MRWRHSKSSIKIMNEEESKVILHSNLCRIKLKIFYFYFTLQSDMEIFSRGDI